MITNRHSCNSTVISIFTLMVVSTVIGDVGLYQIRFNIQNDFIDKFVDTDFVLCYVSPALLSNVTWYLDARHEALWDLTIIFYITNIILYITFKMVMTSGMIVPLEVVYVTNQHLLQVGEDQGNTKNENNTFEQHRTKMQSIMIRDLYVERIVQHSV